MRITKHPTVEYMDREIRVVGSQGESLGTLLKLIVSDYYPDVVLPYTSITVRQSDENKYQLVVIFPSGAEQILATEL